MTIIDHEMLWRQFEPAVDMLGDALRDCPDELWEKRLWEDVPDQWVAAGFSTIYTSPPPKCRTADGKFIPVRGTSLYFIVKPEGE